jgi:hypothetical protein
VSEENVVDNEGLGVSIVHANLFSFNDPMIQK